MRRFSLVFVFVSLFIILSSFVSPNTIKAICGAEIVDGECFHSASGTNIFPYFSCGEIINGIEKCCSTELECAPMCGGGDTCVMLGNQCTSLGGTPGSCGSPEGDLGDCCLPQAPPSPCPADKPICTTQQSTSCTGTGGILQSCSLTTGGTGTCCQSDYIPSVSGCGTYISSDSCEGDDGPISPFKYCGVDIQTDEDVCCSADESCPAVDNGVNEDVCPNYVNGTGAYTYADGCVDLVRSMPICPAVYCGIRQGLDICAWPPEWCEGYELPTSDQDCGATKGPYCIDSNDEVIMPYEDCTDLDCDPNDNACKALQTDGSECCVNYTSCSNYHILNPPPKIFCNQDGYPTSSITDGEGNPHRLYTALGCFRIDDINLIDAFFLEFGVGMAGGVALFLIIVGSVQIMTSAGDPQRVQAGKELIAAAISGLLLLIFGVYILRIIGVTILGIPGL